MKYLKTFESYIDKDGKLRNFDFNNINQNSSDDFEDNRGDYCEDCEECDGTGSVICYTCDGCGYYYDEEESQCHDCSGGKLVCYSCDGTGKYETY
jgi:RecJ-like exonuclease